jgi:membrane-bound ClpP family serine protease
MIVVGVACIAYSATGLSFPEAGSIAILGVIALVLGLIMVIGAIWIDLSQLNRERSRQAQP